MDEWIKQYNSISRLLLPVDIWWWWINLQELIWKQTSCLATGIKIFCFFIVGWHWRSHIFSMKYHNNINYIISLISITNWHTDMLLTLPCEHNNNTLLSSLTTYMDLYSKWHFNLLSEINWFHNLMLCNDVE